MRMPSSCSSSTPTLCSTPLQETTGLLEAAGEAGGRMHGEVPAEVGVVAQPRAA
jgi:hypothetical protein